MERIELERVGSHCLGKGSDSRRRRAARAFLLWAALAAFLAGCSWQEQSSRPTIVLLISIDTLRPDHLGAYGYARPTSPHLDALAERGALFENAFATSPWTLPSHASILTGLYPSRHRLRSRRTQLPKEVPTLAGILAAHGWETAAAVNSENLGERFGLSRDFERFLFVAPSARQVVPTSRITDQAMTWLGEPRTRRLFLFLHYYDVHSDYSSMDEYEDAFVESYAGSADGSSKQLLAVRNGEVALGPDDAQHLVDLYDAGIRQMDDELGRLFAFLQERGLDDRSLVLITSDHGEEFFEHGGVLHGVTHYDEVLRVPLFFVGPGVPAGQRITADVSLVDIAPSVLGALGIASPTQFDGLDLSPLWRNADASLQPRSIFAEADHPARAVERFRAILRDRYKLIYELATGDTELYDLERDPGERSDLSARHPALAQQLLAELNDRPAEGSDGAVAQELTPEDREKLRSLGYVE